MDINETIKDLVLDNPTDLSLTIAIGKLVKEQRKEAVIEQLNIIIKVAENEINNQTKWYLGPTDLEGVNE